MRSLLTNSLAFKKFMLESLTIHAREKACNIFLSICQQNRYWLSTDTYRCFSPEWGETAGIPWELD